MAEEMGYHDEVEAFAEGVVDPHYLPATDPARLLSDRYRIQQYRAKRRPMVDDWTLLVYAFNLQIEGKELGKLVLNDVWPRVAEPTKEYRKRANRLHQERLRVTEKRISVTKSA